MKITRNKPTHLGKASSIRLSPLMESIIENASQKTGATKAWILRTALADFLMGDYVSQIRKRIRAEGMPPGGQRKKKGKGGKAPTRSDAEVTSPP